jgi:hypothetical protein
LDRPSDHVFEKPHEPVRKQLSTRCLAGCRGGIGLDLFSGILDFVDETKLARLLAATPGLFQKMSYRFIRFISFVPFLKKMGLLQNSVKLEQPLIIETKY